MSQDTMHPLVYIWLAKFDNAQASDRSTLGFARQIESVIEYIADIRALFGYLQRGEEIAWIEIPNMLKRIRECWNASQRLHCINQFNQFLPPLVRAWIARFVPNLEEFGSGSVAELYQIGGLDLKSMYQKLAEITEQQAPFQRTIDRSLGETV